MAISFIPPNGEHRLDQTAGAQFGGLLNKDDFDFTLDVGAAEPYDLSDLLADNDLPNPFEAFLEGLAPVISPAQWGNAIDYGYAYEDDGAGYFLTVDSGEGESVTNLYFSDSDGMLFNGDVAQYNSMDIHVAGETDTIYLYSFADGDILIGSTEGPGDVDITDASTLDGAQVVFAYYLDEATDAEGNVLGADIWGVTFEPLEHFEDGDDSSGEFDDAIDFGDFLHVTADATLSFNFDTLESGKFLWVAVGDSDHGLLVTGRDLHVQDPGHAKEGDRINGGQDPSDAVNTSQGGQEATIGINNQLWVPGNEGVFTLVRGFDALGDGPDATGNNVTEIDYDNSDPYINTQGAGVFISQTQGNTPIGFKVEVLEAGGGTTPEEGYGYIDSSGTSGGDGNNGTSPAFEDDTAVPVDMVMVYDENMQLVATWDADDASNGTQQAGITVDITGNLIEVTGLSVLYTVKWTAYDGDTFNRFTLEATEGKFDVGKVLVDEGVKITENIGEDVLIHDDGPTAAITDTGQVVIHDETAGVQDGSEPDDDNLPDPHDDHDQALDLVGPDTTDQDNLPAAFAALGTAIGWAQNASAVVSSTGSSYGTDGAGTMVWSLGVGTDEFGVALTDVDSTLNTNDGYDILLNVEGGIVVGRIDADEDGDVDTGDDVAIAVSLSQAGILSVAQFVPVSHEPDTGPDQQVAMIDTALVATLTVTDADGDFAVETENIGDKVIIEDAAPIGGSLATGVLEEDDLPTGNDLDPDDPAVNDGNGDGSGTNTSVTLEVEDGVTATGTDAPVSFEIDSALAEGVLTGGEFPDMYSKGDQLTYVLTRGTLITDPDATITAYAEYVDGDDMGRKVWEFTLTDFGDGTADATFSIHDQMDHWYFGDNVEGVDLLTDPADWADDTSLTASINEIDFTDLLDLEDADGDPVTLSSGFLTYEIQDDRPIIAANADGTDNDIDDGFVDFTTIDGANENDFGGTSVSSVTESLNGYVGTDENDGDDQAGDGTKTYTFASYSNDQTAIANLQASLIEDDTRVVYFTDGDNEGNQIGVFDAGDTLYYDNVLNQTTGEYTFTVYQDPPPAFKPFDFEDLPSGQNLHGTIASDKADLGEGGLLIFPEHADLDPTDGEMTNSSETTNTSKGGGPVTIGNSNQMFDPGEGHYFVYVDNPDFDATAGLGLDQNNADDADTVGFDGLVEADVAEVEIVQVQGGNPASFTITSYDLTLTGAVGGDGSGDPVSSRDFVLDPTSGTGYSSSQVDVIGVYVFLASDLENAIYWETDDGDATNDFDPDGYIVFSGGSATVGGVDDDYVVQWVTDGAHDMTLIHGETGKYDIGGFNLAQVQPTPDQEFDFTVEITDYDGDTDLSNEFSVLVDGTGTWDNDGVGEAIA